MINGRGSNRNVPKSVSVKKKRNKKKEKTTNRTVGSTVTNGPKLFMMMDNYIYYCQFWARLYLEQNAKKENHRKENETFLLILSYWPT